MGVLFRPRLPRRRAGGRRPLRRRPLRGRPVWRRALRRRPDRPIQFWTLLRRRRAQRRRRHIWRERSASGRVPRAYMYYEYGAARALLFYDGRGAAEECALSVRVCVVLLRRSGALWLTALRDGSANECPVDGWRRGRCGRRQVWGCSYYYYDSCAAIWAYSRRKWHRVSEVRSIFLHRQRPRCAATTRSLGVGSAIRGRLEMAFLSSFPADPARRLRAA